MKTWLDRSMLLCLLLGWSPLAAAFSLDDVITEARALATRPYRPSAAQIPPALLDLSYDQYRAIQFVHARSWWRRDGLPFQLEFFLPGNRHKQVVSFSEISPGSVSPIPFEPGLFEMENHQPLNIPSPGYAGFRLEYSPGHFNEVAAFLDASYFRMVGRGQNYGASARGLAVNPLAAGNEEFPVFKHFWIERPANDATEITAYALLDSPSVAGAYRFIIRPGAPTVATIKATLFPRREIKQLGIAPLSSMFLHGQTGPWPFADYRPEVHDSDGLQIETGHGEWIWHPLDNGKTAHFNSFQDDAPRGFGLMQRDRDFDHYQDPAAKYETRPSIWVRFLQSPGPGAVELMQLPTDQEYNDNIVACWVPAVPPASGVPLNLEYEISWTTANPEPADLGRVLATRLGQVPEDQSRWRLLVDFAGPSLAALKTKPSSDIVLGAGLRPVATNLFQIAATGAWRLVLEMPPPHQAADFRAFLKQDGRRLTETSTFTWQP